jgi:hypothetical protein
LQVDAIVSETNAVSIFTLAVYSADFENGVEGIKLLVSRTKHSSIYADEEMKKEN